MRRCMLYVLCILFLILPAAVFPEDLDDYTVFSNDNLILRDRVRIANSLLGSNSGIQMGYDGVLNGSVLSRGNMVMWNRAVVSGNVKLSGVLTLNTQAKVNGTVTQNTAVSSVTIPAVSFSAGTADHTVGNGAVKILAPGAYRNVQVSLNAALYLEGGTYSFNTLTLQADASLYFNCTNGPVDIRVLGEIKIAERGRLIISKGSLDTSEVRIYSHQTSALQIGTDGRIEAVMTLPRAGVVVGDRTILTGKLRAKSVTIGYDVPLNGAALADSDGDGMPDGWEIVNGLNPSVNDAGVDPDHDGIDNIHEFTYGTKPKSDDTDSDGLKDGDEFDYWGSRDDGISWNDDVEPYTPASGRKGDGLHNIIDPDSDNDGLLDGQEVTGWTAVVQGTSKFVTPDPARADSDYDGIPDGKERDGYDTDFPNHTINKDDLMYGDSDFDGDGIRYNTEITYGLDPNDVHTLGYMHDSKYYDLINHMGEWAVSPVTGHLNPQLASTSTCILGANMSFGDDSSTEMSIDRQMELSVFLPQDGKPITFQLDFVYDGAADTNDRFYDIKYSGAVYPEGTDGAPAMNCPVTNKNSITWKITDSLYYLRGDYFLNFSYHYDKNAGEKPRKIRLFAYYDDGTRVRIEYISPVKDGQYKTPLHFTLLVAGGDQPAYFRGETAVSTASSSYISNVVVTDYNGNVVRSIGKKAFDGYWFQYELGKLNSYSGGTSGVFACNRLEFDWVHDPASDKNHCIFVIDEIGNDWDDVQITYQSRYATQDYYCWYGGLAKNTAVLRRGKPIHVAATNSSLQYGDAQMIVKNRAGGDVSWLFNIHKESGFEDYQAYDGEKTTWRENWIVDVPETAPAGMYTIEMHNGWSWTGSTSFYLIFNKHEMSLSGAEYDGYCYDEDLDGLALDAHTDTGIDLYNTFDTGDVPNTVGLAPCSKTVVDITVAVIEGKTTLFEARDAIRVFIGKLIVGAWTFNENETEYNQAWGGPDDVLRRSGVTVAEVLAGTIDDSHLLYGDCINFACMSTALSRSIGIPGRMVTGRGIYKPSSEPDPVDGKYKPSSDTWIVHVWSEAWIENPPTGFDKWYVFDSTDFVWTVDGSSASRLEYGSLWMTPEPRAYVSDFEDVHIMKSVKEYYKP